MVICFGHRRGKSLQNKTKKPEHYVISTHVNRILNIYYRKGLLVKDEINCNIASIKESLNISYL